MFRPKRKSEPEPLVPRTIKNPIGQPSTQPISITVTGPAGFPPKMVIPEDVWTVKINVSEIVEKSY